MTAFDKYVDNLTLTVGHRGLSRINVNSLSMLHCRELVAGHGAPRIGSGGGLDYAEVGISYHEESVDVEQDVTRNATIGVLLTGWHFAGDSIMDVRDGSTILCPLCATTKRY